LGVHAVRNSSGWDCDGCEHLHDRQDPHPHEVLAVVKLLVELFRERAPDLFPRSCHVSKRDGVWRQTEQVA
jgi:hypothetical protein